MPVKAVRPSPKTAKAVLTASAACRRAKGTGDGRREKHHNGGVMKIAAVQLDVAFAGVDENLRRCEALIGEAAGAGAVLIVLPEFFATAIGFSDLMLDAVIKNAAVPPVMLRWAARHDVIIGGSNIILSGGEAYNRFDLVFPDGQVFSHGKDIPTQFENCYYTAGDKSYILHTPIGAVGVALCWEMIRYDTLRALAGRADIILAGSCWWDLPLDAPPEREPLRAYNQALARNTPAIFAKLAGIPLVHANHCGLVTASDFPGATKRQTRRLVGAAQIVDYTGAVLAGKPFSDGPGFVMADVSWENNSGQAPGYPPGYWIPDLPDSYIRAWETLGPQGRDYYERVSRPYYSEHRQNKPVKSYSSDVDCC
ncbi:MAG: carbon-nitrogen hydrolase family protein [Oscillospiraceae bacterium]|nr:carbon-nitrogen hydrolase family protein [Oscillospiraceae bacterium]